MLSLLDSLCGPLAEVECRRMLASRWWQLIRPLASVPAAAIMVLTLWIWWVSSAFHPGFNPMNLVKGTTVGIETLVLLTTVLWTPALLAGTLAGDKEAGTLGLLLISRATPREIVLARLTGRLCRLAAVLGGSMPILAFCAGLSGLGLIDALGLAALAPATALGAAGASLFSSAVSRRGRDALIAVYLTGVVVVLFSIFARDLLPIAVADWLRPFNPFSVPAALLYIDDSGPLWRCLTLWTGMGVLGTTAAALLVGPAYLRYLGGDEKKGPASRGRVPAVSERPMLWKELHIERARHLGKFGQVLAVLLVGVMLAGSVVPAAILAWHHWYEPIDNFANAALVVMEWTIGYTAVVVGWLVQWAIGLRASFSISVERQQGTWDGLLTSPLEGREIVGAKLLGSLFAMRGLLASLIVAWTLAVVCGAISPGVFAHVVADTLLAGAFMAAVGIWISLATSTTTEAMTMAIGAWLGAAIVTSMVALMVVGAGALLIALVQEFAIYFGFFTTMPTLPFDTSFALVRSSMYLAATFLLAWHCWTRFDFLAGRGCAGLVLVTKAPPRRAVPVAEARPTPRRIEPW